MVLNFSYYIPNVGSALLLTFNQRLSAFNRFILNNSNVHRKRERAKTERYRHEDLIFILILNETVSFFSLFTIINTKSLLTALLRLKENDEQMK